LQTPLLVGTGLFILGPRSSGSSCAIYAYRLAPTYGRGAWPWAIAAIFLGPFALFALVLLPKRPVMPAMASIARIRKPRCTSDRASAEAELRLGPTTP
jgi:hypothetical protein